MDFFVVFFNGNIRLVEKVHVGISGSLPMLKSFAANIILGKYFDEENEIEILNVEAVA